MAASGQSHPSPENRPSLTHFVHMEATLVFKVCIRTLNFFLFTYVSPELASKDMMAWDFVCLSFWCLEGDLVLGRLTGTSGSSGVEQCLLLMQPLYAVHQGQSLFGLCFPVFSSFGLKPRSPVGLPARGCWGVCVTSQSFGVSLAVSLSHLQSSICDTIDPAIFLKLSKSTWNRNLTSQWTWKENQYSCT